MLGEICDHPGLDDQFEQRSDWIQRVLHTSRQECNDYTHSAFLHHSTIPLFRFLKAVTSPFLRLYGHSGVCPMTDLKLQRSLH